MKHHGLTAAIANTLQPLNADLSDTRPFDALILRMGNARMALLGEASHGAREFYAIRAMLTRRLIQEKGFHAVTAETDWPDALHLGRYVQGMNDDNRGKQALAGFSQFLQRSPSTHPIFDSARGRRK